MIGYSYIRVIVVNLEEDHHMDKLAKMRPWPSHYVALGTQSTIQDIYFRAKNVGLPTENGRWTFVFQDWHSDVFPLATLDAQAVFMTLSEDDCCRVMNIDSLCSCAALLGPGPTFVEEASYLGPVQQLFHQVI